MTREEFLKLEIDSLIFNRDKNILCKVACSYSHSSIDPSKTDEDEKLNIWTRNVFSIHGFSESGCGDINIKDHEEWEVFYGEQTLLSDALRISMLEVKVQQLTDFIFSRLR